MALALSALPLLMAVLRQASCLQTGWAGRAPLWRECSSDLLTSFLKDHLGRGLAAYLRGEVVLAQPMGSGAVMTFLGGLVPASSPLGAQRWYLALWVVVSTVAVLATVALVARTRGEPRAQVLQAALAPVLALGVLVGPDMVGVALATGGLWAWSRERPALAGALLGAGTLTRSYPLLLAIAITLLAASTRRRHVVRLWTALTATVVIGALPLALASWESLTSAYAAWWSGPAGVGSFWLIPSMAGAGLDARVAAALAAVGWVIALSLAAAMVKGARVPVTPAQVSLLVVAVVLVTSKNVPVQSSLWLVPLVALAGLRWRDHLIWAAAEAAHFAALWYYLGGLEVPDKGLPAPWYTLFLLLRLAAIARLAWTVWDRAVWPSLAD